MSDTSFKGLLLKYIQQSGLNSVRFNFGYIRFMWIKLFHVNCCKLQLYPILDSVLCLGTFFFTLKNRGITVAMTNVLHHAHQSHLLFPLHPPISAVHSKTQAFHFPQSMAPVNLRTNLSVRRRSVKCMANPRRVKMVAKQIMRELSDMLLTDTVLQHAVLPEAALGADRYLSSLTTISDVEVSNDLQVII